MSGALGKCSPTRLLCLLGLNPSDEDDHVSDRVLIMLDPNDREGALANILYRTRPCPNDHEGALVRSLELVHRLVGLYLISFCSTISIHCLAFLYKFRSDTLPSV